MQVVIDDRPIKPDKEYLQKYLQEISKPEIKEYLKKKAFPVLPCQLQYYQEIKQRPVTSNRQSQKTKRQIYEQIKQQNRSKFGQKKPQQSPPQPPQPKKINPKKITINYKPKVKIQTEQYKKPGYKPSQQKKQQRPLQKQQYAKLLQYFKEQLTSFQTDKEQFDKVASILKFKKGISQEQGLLYTKIKKQVQKRFLNTQISYKDNLQHHHSTDKLCSKSHKCLNLNPFQKNHKALTVNQLKQQITKTQVKINYIQSKLFTETYKIDAFRYDINSLHLLPDLQLTTLSQYMNHEELKYNGNKLYKSAVQAFNAKFKSSNGKKDKDKMEGMKDQGLNEEENVREEIKMKFVGEKRICKYAGWTEVWIPGKQRLLTNNQNYKVIWLHNGDVIQQYSKTLTTYYSKLKNILKIQIKDKATIYYHDDTKQLWKELPDNKKEIVYLTTSNPIKSLLEQ